MGIDSMVEAWTDRLHDAAFSTAPQFIKCTWCDNYLHEEDVSWVVPDYVKTLDCGFCSQECLDEWFEDSGWEIKEEYEANNE